MYKTPTALTSELQDAEESLNNTLTLLTSEEKATKQVSDKGTDQKLTLVLPSSGFISNPFNGAKPKASTPLQRVLENTNFQTLSSIDPNSKCTSETKISKLNEKPASEKHLITPSSESQTSRRLLRKFKLPGNKDEIELQRKATTQIAFNQFVVI